MTVFVLLLVNKGLTTLKIKSHKFLLAWAHPTWSTTSHWSKKHGHLKAVLLVLYIYHRISELHQLSYCLEGQPRMCLRLFSFSSWNGDSANKTLILWYIKLYPIFSIGFPCFPDFFHGLTAAFRCFFPIHRRFTCPAALLSTAPAPRRRLSTKAATRRAQVHCSPGQPGRRPWPHFCGIEI